MLMFCQITFHLIWIFANVCLGNCSWSLCDPLVDPDLLIGHHWYTVEHDSTTTSLIIHSHQSLNLKSFYNESKEWALGIRSKYAFSLVTNDSALTPSCCGIPHPLNSLSWTGGLCLYLLFVLLPPLPFCYFLPLFFSFLMNPHPCFSLFVCVWQEAKTMISRQNRSGAVHSCLCLVGWQGNMFRNNGERSRQLN